MMDPDTRNSLSFSVGVVSSLNAPFTARSSLDPTEFLAGFLLLMQLRNFIYGTFCLLAFIFVIFLACAYVFSLPEFMILSTHGFLIMNFVERWLVITYFILPLSQAGLDF